MSEWHCDFNDAIDCSKRDTDCSKCGWNPVVAEERLRKIIEERLSNPEAEPEVEGGL